MWSRWLAPDTIKTEQQRSGLTVPFALDCRPSQTSATYYILHQAAMDYPHSGRVNVSGFNTVVSLMHDQAGPLKPLLNQLGVNT